MNWYSTVLALHIALGALALSAFWCSAILRKGTSTHRRVGAIYLGAMLAVMASAAPLAAAAFAAGHILNGIFLAFLILITGTPLWVARRAIRCRHSAAEFAGGPYLTIGALNIAFALAVLSIGLATQTVLLIGFSLVGLFVGTRIVRFAFKGATSRQWWLKQHYLGMVGSGIASHIAFLNVGLPHLIPERLGSTAQYLAWFGPIAVALFAQSWLNRRYERGADGVRLSASVPKPV